MIRSIAAIILRVSDLEQACDYYKNTIGLKLAYKNSASGWAEFDLAGVRIALQLAEPHGHGDNPMLALYTYKLESTVELLKRRGVQFLDDGHVQSDFFGRSIRFRDPFDNILTLFEANES